MTPTRARATVIVAIALAMSAIAPAARADSAYRYWTYWIGDDAGWSFAQEGPATRLPADGDVEGWRFEISTAAGSPDLAPRTDVAAVFDDACGSTPHVDGKKRIAVALDFGDPSDAADGATPPEAQVACAVVGDDATSAQALAALVDIRAENGMVCGLAGYPATGCADLVDPSAMAAAPTTPVVPTTAPGIPGSWLGSVVALALVGLIAAAVTRRRR